MGDVWEFDLPMTPAEREVVLARLRSLRASLSAQTPLAGPLAEFEAQVADGDSRIRLVMDQLDVVGKFHFSSLLENLCPPTGYTSCIRCGGSGDVKLPDSLTRLRGAFENRYSLWQVTGGDREWYLNQSADPVVRKRAVDAANAEQERRRESIRRSERVRLLPPGSVREDDFERAV